MIWDLPGKVISCSLLLIWAVDEWGVLRARGGRRGMGKDKKPLTANLKNEEFLLWLWQSHHQDEELEK